MKGKLTCKEQPLRVYVCVCVCECVCLWMYACYITQIVVRLKLYIAHEACGMKFTMHTKHTFGWFYDFPFFLFPFLLCSYFYIFLRHFIGRNFFFFFFLCRVCYTYIYIYMLSVHTPIAHHARVSLGT